jgi:hypothetical protein
MFLHLPISPAGHETVTVLWMDRPLPENGLLYLFLAAVSLLVALRFVKRAMAPIGTLVRAVAAAAGVAFAIGVALAFVAAAVLNGR